MVIVNMNILLWLLCGYYDWKKIIMIRKFLEFSVYLKVVIIVHFLSFHNIIV
jgi:hypothetical protein